MSKSIIDETLLRKNIDLLSMYSEEEKQKCDMVFDRMRSGLASYKSSNTSRMQNKLTNLKNQMPTISSNRKEYEKIIEAVIMKYRESAQAFVSSAQKAGGDIHV